MDYPQLNLLFGLGLILMLVTGICLRVLLSKTDPPAWMSWLSGAALVLSILAALYIGILFLRFMTPSFNLQIGLGLLVIGSLGALVTAALSRRGISPRAAGFLFGAQMVASLLCLLLAFGLYRSLVPL